MTTAKPKSSPALAKQLHQLPQVTSDYFSALPEIPELLLTLPVISYPSFQHHHDKSIKHLCKKLSNYHYNTPSSMTSGVCDEGHIEDGALCDGAHSMAPAKPTAAAKEKRITSPEPVVSSQYVTDKIDDATLKSLKEEFDQLLKERKKAMVNDFVFALERSLSALPRYQVEVQEHVTELYKKKYQSKNVDDLRRELEGVIELSMRLFLAYNVTGALGKEEASHFLPVLKRFDSNASEILKAVSATAASKVNIDNNGIKGKEAASLSNVPQMTVQLHHNYAEDSVKDLKLARERFIIRLLTTDGEMPTPALILPRLLLLCEALIGCTLTENNSPVVQDVTASEIDIITCDTSDKSKENVNQNFQSVNSSSSVAEPERLIFSKNNIWRLRVFFRHQLCLLHRSHTLFINIADCIDAILADSILSQKALVLVEIGHVMRYYHKRDMAANIFERAQQLTGLQLEETSIMGVRTRWQQHKLAQTLLKATSFNEDGLTKDSSSIQQHQSFLKTINGEKDGFDLYDYPRASTDAKDQDLNRLITPLTLTDKAIIMGFSLNLSKLDASHCLTAHHQQVYLERLIVDSGPEFYIQRAMLLLLRARLERRRSARLQQRSFLQIQDLIDNYSSAINAASLLPCHDNAGCGDYSPHQQQQQLELCTFYRTDSRYFYSIPYPSIWSLRREFAEFCCEDSLYKTALNLFEQIHDWDNIIRCCKALDKRRRAKTLALELLEEDPLNPMLWVALGEATHDTQHLWKAWELSKHMMAAPMRALAKFALQQQKWEECIEYFDKAVVINPVFGGDWFALGFASLKLHHIEQGTVAFTRVCQIDPDDAYAWNNLGSLLLEQGKHRPAFNAISQALRNNRRSWRMWQNYFSIGAELGEVTECTHALAVMLEIGKREVALEGSRMEKFIDTAIKYLKTGEQGVTNDNHNENDDDNNNSSSSPDNDTAENKSSPSSSSPVENKMIHVVNSELQEQHQQLLISPKASATNTPTLFSHIIHSTISGCAVSLATEITMSNIVKATHATSDGRALDELVTSEGETETTDIVPLGSEIEMPHAFFAKLNKDGKNSEEQEAMRKKGILMRYEKRLKKVLNSCLSLFVDDADLYNCVARLYRFTDGAAAAYIYRQKEYRVCSQQDQVYRVEKKFQRFVQCIKSMTDDAVDMLDKDLYEKKALDDGASVIEDRKIRGSSIQELQNSSNGTTKITMDNLQSKKDTLTEPQRLTQVVDAFSAIKGHIDCALELAEEHFLESRDYMVLECQRMRLETATKICKTQYSKFVD